MDSIDATNRTFEVASVPSPSLLVIVLDTNPIAWAELNPSLPLSTFLTSLQIYINAHLALNPTNQVAVLASHIDRAEWLYPATARARDLKNRQVNGNRTNGQDAGNVDAQAANSYQPFVAVEREIRSSLQRLVHNTSPSSIAAFAPTQLAGALTTALTYINKQTQLSSPMGGEGGLGTDNALAGVTLSDGTISTGSESGLVSRVMVVSVSGDLSSQYISVMNAIFAAQRRQIPIDVLKLTGDTGFLQQACDATGGVYLEPAPTSLQGMGLLQYLLMAYLPDVPARKSLQNPGKEAVDFRAACFCHQRVIDLGFVCSVCLSIFCEPPADLVCLTCGTGLTPPPHFGVKPVVVPKKKKKKKRPTDAGSGAGTPIAAR